MGGSSNNLVLVNYFNTFELQNINFRIKTLKFYNSLLLLAGTCTDILRGRGSSKKKKGTSHIYLIFSKQNVKYIRDMRY